MFCPTITLSPATLPNGTAASNLAYAASTNAEAARVIATNALEKSATNALAVTALQVTSGSPTKGAVLQATNNFGQATWARKLTKHYTFTTQTTNTANVTVTGIGFRPAGLQANASAYIATPTHAYSVGFVDGAGSQSVIYSYSGTADSSVVDICAAIYPSTLAWKLTWTAWTDDGATFTQTSDGGVANHVVKVYILFFP